MNSRAKGTPFSQAIITAAVTLKFKAPTMNSYDPSGDLISYFKVFEGNIDFLAASDTMNCQTFQVALEGLARLCYMQLKPKSTAVINSCL